MVGLLPGAVFVAASALLPLVSAADKTPGQLIAENGYPAEVYAVRSDDGYVNRLDRIANPGKPPVLIANPILSSGSVYLQLGANHSLGFALYDAGFDVFIGCDRGTVWSQDFGKEYGSSISPDLDEYFLFSFHEHAVYDNPAFIRTILNVTGRSQLQYIGYSMGATELLAMVAELPEEMNAVLISAHVMSPVMTYSNRSELYKLLHYSENVTSLLLDLLSYHRTPARSLDVLAKLLCPGSFTAPCNEVMYFLFDSARRLDYLGNFKDRDTDLPGGGSWGELLHDIQNTRYPGRFKQYDHGAAKNLVKYGTADPPDYVIENIKIPLHVYRGLSDTLFPDEDNEKIASRVPGYVNTWVHPISGFSHLDFIYDFAAVAAYKQIIEDLNKYL